MRLRRLVAALVAALVLSSVGAGWMYRRIRSPYRGFAGAEVFVELPTGTSVARIGSRLAEAGVVPDPWTFRIAVRLAGADRRLQAGEYRFAEAAAPSAVVARLAGGDVYRRPMTFPEGLTMAEMAAVFERAGLGPAADFQAAANEPALRAAHAPEARSLE